MQIFIQLGKLLLKVVEEAPAEASEAASAKPFQKLADFQAADQEILQLAMSFWQAYDTAPSCQDYAERVLLREMADQYVWDWKRALESMLVAFDNTAKQMPDFYSPRDLLTRWSVMSMNSTRAVSSSAFAYLLCCSHWRLRGEHIQYFVQLLRQTFRLQKQTQSRDISFLGHLKRVLNLISCTSCYMMFASPNMIYLFVYVKKRLKLDLEGFENSVYHSAVLQKWSKRIGLLSA